MFMPLGSPKAILASTYENSDKSVTSVTNLTLFLDLVSIRSPRSIHLLPLNHTIPSPSQRILEMHLQVRAPNHP